MNIELTGLVNWAIDRPTYFFQLPEIEKRFCIPKAHICMVQI